ncbi:unnamed protein product [Rhizophagus irregularis]|nr:unnamed protein product [Rhizophagus irregularis]
MGKEEGTLQRGTKIYFGWTSNLQNRRNQDLFGELLMNGNQDFSVSQEGFQRLENRELRFVVFRRTENGELRSWVSWVSSEKWKKPKFVSDLGWVSEEQKKKMNLNGLVSFKVSIHFET